jgi:hypothetical protein
VSSDSSSAPAGVTTDSQTRMYDSTATGPVSTDSQTRMAP